MAVDLSKNEDLQRLFLLELLVDCIKFDYGKIDLNKSVLNLLKQTCVRFNFLNFPVIEVCEEDFCQTQGDYKANDIVFKNGKSCFFSLSCLPLNTECLKIGATIIRKKDEPPPVVIGTTCIQLDRSFVNVLNNYNHTYEAGEACKSLKDVFPIFDDKGIMIGTITLFVRLSCFGKAIITHFKIPLENETGYLFKNTNEPGQSNVAGQTLTPDSPKGHGSSPGSPKGSSPPDSPKSPRGKKQGSPDMVSGPRSNISPDLPNNASGDMQGLGNTPGMVPGGALGMDPSDKQGMYPGSMPGMGPGGNRGIYPAMYPGGVPGIQPGGMPGIQPGGMPGIQPGGMPRIYPGGMPGMYPGSMPGMYPGGLTGVHPGGMSGVFSEGAPGTFPGSMPGMIPREISYGALGDMGGIVPYSAANSLLNLRHSIDYQISKDYKELAVTINGHEFTINVLRKSRKKREKTPELQLCGRLPTKESSDSEESTDEEESVVRSGKKKREVVKRKEEEKKEKETVILRVNNVYQPAKIKSTKNNIPKPQLSQQQTQKQDEIPFSLCECDIPLPKGFRVPETIGKPRATDQDPSHSSMLTISPPPSTATAPTTAPPMTIPDSPPPTAATSLPVTQSSTPMVSNVSIPIVKNKKEKIPPKVKESPKIYCLKPNCPMGFPWPPNIPLQTKVVKVPCCSPMPMHAGSVGIKGDNVVFQTTNGFTQSFGESSDQKKSAYVLKLGATNLPSSKCTKMIMELPVPKIKIKKLKTYDTDTQYLETDIPVPHELKPDTGKNLKDNKKGKKKGKGKGKKKGKEKQ